MKRWMVAAVAGLAAVAGTAAPGAAQASSGAWYQVYQAGVRGYFTGIAAISDRNIWAVGHTFTATGKPIYTPVIRHFNGSSWQPVTIPHDWRAASDWVSASAADNVWVGGLRGTAGGTSVVYRWNGARWERVPVPATTDLQGVAVLGPGNVWAFGGSGAFTDDVLHWNGTRWRGYLDSSLNFVPQDISALAANDIWISGFALSHGKPAVAAYRWNGKAWHPVSMPHPVYNNAGPNVTAVSRSNVWIGYRSHAKAYLLHWDGHHWHAVNGAPYYADPLNIVPDGKGGYWLGAQAILTASTWTSEQLPEFSGGYGDVTRIPGTTSFLIPAGVETGPASIERPTLYRFDL